jgi:putative MFS transporter
MIGWLALLTNLPLFVTGLLNLWIIPNFGWQYMFLIGGVAALIIWFLRKSLPESPRWLELQGRHKEADAILRSIEAGSHGQVATTNNETGAAAASAATTQTGSLATLFSRPYISKTITGMFLHSVVNLCFYGFIGWMPSFFVKQGATVATSLWWTTVMALGAPVGALIGLSISDRVGRKPSIIAACLIAALFGAGMPFVAGNGAALMAVGFSCFTAIYVLHAVGYALYVPEMFPTEIRLRGVGVCSSVARLSTAGTQVGVVALFAWGGVMAVVGALDICLVALAALVAILGIETRGKSLEQIAHTRRAKVSGERPSGLPAGTPSID